MCAMDVLEETEIRANWKKDIVPIFRGEYDFLSNFYPCNNPIEYRDCLFGTVEQAYQCSKTKDREIFEKMSKMTASQCKKFGKTVLLRDDWEEIKDIIMYFFVFKKFSKNKYLRDKLLCTGNMILIEGNYWGDNYWGAPIVTTRNNNGKRILDVNLTLDQALFLSSPLSAGNKLGKILMLVREELKLRDNEYMRSLNV